jgi:hypothetical protein
MKKLHIALTALLLTTILYSCKKDGVQTIDQIIEASTPQIKYFNFGVNAPAANFYANGVKVSAALSATGTESTSGVTSGGVYPASNYSLLNAGTYTFEARLPSSATADPDLSIASLSGTLEANKFYTLYLCGLYTNKRSDAFIVEDKLPAVDYNVAYVRFVNTVPNATSNLSLYAHNTLAATGVDLLVANNIAYKSASNFVPVPIGTYELFARYPSAPTVNVISRNGTSSVAFVGGKVYTIGSRGDITVTAATATNRPQLDNTANR